MDKKSVMFIFIGLFLVFALTTHAQAMDWQNGLIAYYPMNETTGTVVTDVLGNYPGIVYGAVVNQTGKIGTGYNYTLGTSVWSTNDTNNLPISGSMNRTYNFWWNHQPGGSGGQSPFIYSAGGTTGDYLYYNEDVANHLYWEVGDIADVYVGSRPNGWHMYTMRVVNESGTCNASVYLDGVLQTSSTGTVFTTAGKLWVGGFPDNSWESSNATDELGIWGRALSISEIQELYNSSYGLSYSPTEWWNSSYSKRKAIKISNALRTITGYQAYFNISYDSDMQSDFDDLRFTDIQSNELDYYIENFSASDYASVWVELNLTVNQNTTIYMYYGNSTVPNSSNPEETFNFYDNFDAVNTSKWYASAGSESVSGGIVDVSDDNLNGQICFGDGYIHEANLTKASGNNMGMALLNSSTLPPDTNDMMRWIDITPGDLKLINANDGSATEVDSGTAFPSGGTYGIGGVVRVNSSVTVGFLNGGSRTENTGNVPTDNLCPTLRSWTSSHFYVDWYRVRQFIDGSSVTNYFGAEESGSSDTTDPVVTIQSPASNNSYSNDYSMYVNYTAVDETAISLCTWTEDSGVTNYTIACSNLTGPWSDGFKRVGIFANDTSNNWGYAEIYFTTDGVNPSSTINAFTNMSNTSDNTLDLNFTLQDNIGSSINYTWYINGTANKTGVVANATSVKVTSDAFPDGMYRIKVKATDNASNEVNSSEYWITFDTVTPVVALPVYTNLTKKMNTATLTLNISVTDNTPVTPCYVDVTGTNQTIAYSNGWCNGTITLTGLTDGNKTIKVYVNDSANNLALNNSFWLWMDSTKPVATFGINTADGYNYTTSSLVYFDGKCSDAIQVSAIKIYSNFSGSWIPRYTNTSYINNTWINFTEYVTTNNIYNWAVWCNDTTGNENFTANRTFITSWVAPTPPSGSGSGSPSINGTNGSCSGINHIIVNVSELWTNNEDVIGRFQFINNVENPENPASVDIKLFSLDFYKQYNVTFTSIISEKGDYKIIFDTKNLDISDGYYEMMLYTLDCNGHAQTTSKKIRFLHGTISDKGILGITGAWGGFNDVQKVGLVMGVVFLFFLFLIVIMLIGKQKSPAIYR